MSDNRSIVYREGDDWIYRASSVGKSLRCLSAARQQYTDLPAPAYLVEAAEQGNRYEVIVKDRLTEQGWEIGGEQSELNIPAAPGTFVRGHMDAESAIDPNGLDLPMEVKSMSKNVWAKFQRDRFGSFPSYASQIVCYLTGMGVRQGHYAVVNRDTDEIQTFIVDLDTTPNLPTWESIVQKIALVEWFAQSGTLPVCDSASEYACPYEYLCDKREILFTEIESSDDESLMRLADQWDEITKLEKDLKARKEDIRADVMVAMGDAKRRKIPGYSISVATRTSKRLDTKRLRDELGDKLDEFYNESESAPFPTIRRSTGKE